MDSFNVFVPFDIVKSEESDAVDERRIAGYASTSDKDRQDDEIIQKGLDISDFVNYGYFNFDHDNSKILGYPDKEKTHIDSKGFWVEGTLLKGVAEADRMWETAVALKKSNAPRRLGYSIEGKTFKRDSLGRIVKAKVYNVAITANPVNPNATWDALVKSFTTDTEEVEKAMEAGHGFEVGEPSNGSVMIPESLDCALKNLAVTLVDEKAMMELKQKLSNQQNLSQEELILYFQVTKGLSRTDSASLVNKLLSM